MKFRSHMPLETISEAENFLGKHTCMQPPDPLIALSYPSLIKIMKHYDHALPCPLVGAPFDMTLVCGSPYTCTRSKYRSNHRLHRDTMPLN